MINIAIIDDHLLFRKSLCLLIGEFQDIKLIFDSANGEELLQSSQLKKVDVVLLDVKMPVMDGFKTCEALKENHPHILVLIISQFSDVQTIYQMMQLGAHGFMSKNANPAQLEMAIRSIKENKFYLETDLRLVFQHAFLLSQNSKHQIVVDTKLTQKELQIIKWAAKGFSIKEIAQKLFVTPRAVEAQRHKILIKTDSKNFLGCVLFALKTKQVTLQEIDYDGIR